MTTYFPSQGKLSAKRIELLNGLGDWSWEPFGDDQWMGWFGKLQEYLEANGTVRVPDDCPLGSWVGAQRRLHRRGQLSADRAELLDNLGDWSWDPNEDQWMEMFGQLQEHFTATGSARGVPKGTPLANWMTNQISFRKRGKMSDERIAMLETLGDWSRGRHADRWEKMFGHAREYHATNGTLWASSNHRTPDGLLYSWMKNQCVALRNGKLSAERMEKLSGIDPTWWDVK